MKKNRDVKYHGPGGNFTWSQSDHEGPCDIYTEFEDERPGGFKGHVRTDDLKKHVEAMGQNTWRLGENDPYVIVSTSWIRHNKA